MDENGQSARPTVALCLSILDFLGWFRRKRLILFPKIFVPADRWPELKTRKSVTYWHFCFRSFPTEATWNRPGPSGASTRTHGRPPNSDSARSSRGGQVAGSSARPSSFPVNEGASTSRGFPAPRRASVDEFSEAALRAVMTQNQLHLATTTVTSTETQLERLLVEQERLQEELLEKEADLEEVRLQRAEADAAIASRREVIEDLTARVGRLQAQTNQAQQDKQDAAREARCVRLQAENARRDLARIEAERLKAEQEIANRRADIGNLGEFNIVSVTDRG